MNFLKPYFESMKELREQLALDLPSKLDIVFKIVLLQVYQTSSYKVYHARQTHQSMKPINIYFKEKSEWRQTDTVHMGEVIWTRAEWATWNVHLQIVRASLYVHFESFFVHDAF